MAMSGFPPRPGEGNDSRANKRKKYRELSDDEGAEFLGFLRPNESGMDGRFIIIQSEEGERPLKSKGYAWVEVAMRGVFGSEKVEKINFLRDGSLLVKTKNRAQTEKLGKVTQFGGFRVKTKDHPTLNRSKGVIHADNLSEMTEEEIKDWMAVYGVVEAHRVTRKVNGVVTKTSTYILTFNRPTLPKELKFDYVNYKVQVYIANPYQCYQCGKYGHGSKKCQNSPVCLRCGGRQHDQATPCEAFCLHCEKAGHSCTDHKCERWLFEKKICKVRAEKGLSFLEAKKICEREAAN